MPSVRAVFWAADQSRPAPQEARGRRPNHNGRPAVFVRSRSGRGCCGCRGQPEAPVPRPWRRRRVLLRGDPIVYGQGERGRQSVRRRGRRSCCGRSHRPRSGRRAPGRRRATTVDDVRLVSVPPRFAGRRVSGRKVLVPVVRLVRRFHGIVIGHWRRVHRGRGRRKGVRQQHLTLRLCGFPSRSSHCRC